MKRVLFVLGLGVGFVLGARAGRERYEHVRVTATRMAGSEPVSQGVSTAQRVFDEATPVIVEGARQLAGRAAEASRRMADRLGEGAQHVGERAASTVGTVRERVTSSADELQARVTHTADDLRARSEELRRRSEEQFDRAGRSFGEQVERGRDAQAESLRLVGDLREQALAEIITDDDEMLEPASNAARTVAEREGESRADRGN